MKKIGRIKYTTMGQYDPEVTYTEMNTVLYEGSRWEAKKETTGNAPPDNPKNDDGTIAENEFWRLFLPGALGDDYVKKTDLSKAPTETEPGKPGINYPDGKTIQMDENGMLTGTPLDFSGTWDELFAGIDSGEVKDGMVGYVKGTKSDPDNPNHPNNLLLDFDDYLSLYSSNAPQNRIVTAMLNQIKALAEQNAQLIEDVKELRARTDTYGLSKICPVDVTDITEANGMVLGGWEKNPAKSGTLANKIDSAFLVRWQSLGAKTVEANMVFNFLGTADSVSGYTPFCVAGLNMNWPTCVAVDFSVNSTSPYNITITGINVGADTPSFTPYIGIVYKKRLETEKQYRNIFGGTQT